MKRREFMSRSAVASALLAVAQANADTSPSDNNTHPIPRREYGKTGIHLSVIGFGGIVVMNAEQDTANRVVAKSVERSINYFDVAPAYGDAEIKLGPALEPYRKDCFLACKTAQRSRKEAEAEFARSLERLRTDHFDLYQLHAIKDVAKDVDVAFAKDGVMEMVMEKKKSGQIRHVGFSAHSIEAATTAMDRYDFDSALVPINFACFEKGHFGPQIIAKAKEKGVAILALKAMARQSWTEGDPKRGDYKKCWYEPLTDRKEVAMGLRWTLAQPVVAAVPPGDARLYEMALDIAEEGIGFTPEDEHALMAMAQDLNPLFTTV